MSNIHRNIIIVLFSFFSGVPIAILINTCIYDIIFIDNGNTLEYRFPKFSWLYRLFYEEYHDEPNLLNIIITFIIGVYITFLLYKLLIKIKLNYIKNPD